MCDGSDTSLVAPVKESTIRASQRTAPSLQVYRDIRCKVECIIGDLTRWAYVRGTSSKTWHCGMAAHKRRIRMCAYLTNFVYHTRKLD